LPPEKLIVVSDFVSYLLEPDRVDLLLAADTDARATMLASEAVLRRDWDRPERGCRMGAFVKGDVVVAPFPFSDLRSRKSARP
jgi:hypothetical protein